MLHVFWDLTSNLNFRHMFTLCSGLTSDPQDLTSNLNLFHEMRAESSQLTTIKRDEEM